VLVVVEVVSPGSARTDHVHKRGEYADAGIPHYCIVDITKPLSLLACHLAGEFGYADGGTVTGRFVTTSRSRPKSISTRSAEPVATGSRPSPQARLPFLGA
jgi:Putative restriction endonuclease